MTTATQTKAFELREQGFAYYRIADELNLSKDDAKAAVVAARDDRKTWLTRQGIPGTRGNAPFVRSTPKPVSKKAARHARRFVC